MSRRAGGEVQKIYELNNLSSANFIFIYRLPGESE